MRIRTILYGYKMEYPIFSIIPEEADIVRRIFKEYISGKTIKSIANALTAENVIYFGDKSSWTKNAVCRIIENEHYVGDYEYQAIISKEEFICANAMKEDKGGKREADTSEVALLKQITVCGECGHHYTRQKKYPNRNERWKCPNKCKATFAIDDKLLYEKINNIINCVIINPNLLCYSNYKELYEPTLELIREENEIQRMFEQKNPKFSPIKRAIYDAASHRYDCCLLDSSKAVTEELVKYVSSLEKCEIIDFKLIEKIVKAITIHADGGIAITFINEKTLSEEENDNDNARGNEKNESCN